MIILTTTTYSQAQTGINDKITSNNEAGLSNKGGYKGIFSDNVGYQLSFMDNQGWDDSQTQKLPKVTVTKDCKKKILEKTNGSTNIVVATIFRQNSFAGNALNIKAGITGIIDVVCYELFPYVNGAINPNQINVKNICNEKVIIYSPLYIEELLKNKAVAVSGQNPETEFEYLRDYDIFDPDSEIYKDICYPLTFSNASENIFTTDSFKNYDISLEQRKKYYFPGNTQLCPKECNYLGFDKDTVSAICECEFTSHDLYNSATYKEHNDYKSFTFDEEEFNDSKKDNYFTMEVFKCITLPFRSIGFKNNYGSYLMLALICIIFLSYIILAISGKYHLLSVLELLYNSNIKSMNYIKGSNLGGSNFLNSNQNPYDTRSNNLLLTSQRGLTSNTLLMGNSNLNGSNANKIKVGKKNNTIKDNKNIQIVNQSNLNKNKNKSQKDDLIKVDEIKENDFESEKNSEDKERTDIKSINKDISTKNENDKNEQKKNESKKSDNEQNEDDVMSEKKNEQNNAEKKNDNNNNNNNNQDEEEEYEEEEDENENENNNNKANPPKKRNSNKNGNGEETKKKKKTPIEIALNVKELREMMFKNMPQAQKKDDDDDNENNKNNNGVQNVPQTNMPQNNNGFPFNPFMNPMSFFPPPFPYNNNNNSNNGNNNNNNNNNNNEDIRREYEERSRQREKEFQRELSQLREKERQRELERQREMEDLRERERQKQRDLDYERERRQRDELFRGYEREKTKKSDKEKDEEIEKQKEEIKKMKKKLEKELKEAQNKGKEQDLELQKELSKVKDAQREKEIEFEKELLRQKDTLREQFEKEKKEIIERKDKEIQNLREEKDREIQRLKEDKDREIKNMKDDMDREKKNQDEKIKQKEKELKQELKKEKKKVKEAQKMTSNSFFMNNFNPNTTLQQQIMDLNNSLKYEKIETPQIVVPIDSIFTDQELNSMDFNNSCQFDKRTLCQVYKSYINRKQPLFFLFNYNSSSSGSVSTFQINYTSVKFIIFCIELQIYLFFYCTFFGSHSITDILNNDFTFKKKCVFAVILSPVCMICKSIIHHFIYDKMNARIAEIKMRCYTNFIVGKKPEEVKVNEFKDFWESEGEQQKEIKEEKKEEMADIQEIEDDNLPEEEKERRKEKYEKRRLKTLIKDLIELFKRKILISIIIITPSLFVEWYYVSAFCAVYKNSQLTFFLNILISYGFSNLIPFVYCMIPTIFRQDAIKEESKLTFFISQIFQII